MLIIFRENNLKIFTSFVKRMCLLWLLENIIVKVLFVATMHIKLVEYQKLVRFLNVNRKEAIQKSNTPLTLLKTTPLTDTFHAKNCVWSGIF